MKLVYFNGRGLAETIRLMLAITETEYEDFRYPLEVIDWKTFKFNRQLFEDDKRSGKLIKSMNKLPFLEDDSHIICQSKSIERYLANKLGLMGNNLLEGAKIDSISEIIRDFKTDYQSIRKLDENEKEAGLLKWFSETLVQKLELLENLVNETYSIGKGISYADIVIYSFILHFFDDTKSSYNSINNLPNLKSIVDNISNNENIKKWIVNRPETPF
jgi:glutathione S-transferase